jgi:putative endonuclease
MGGLDPPIQDFFSPHPIAIGNKKADHSKIMPSGFVYILASKKNGTLYIGVTSDLLKRMEQHRMGEGSIFVKKYGVTKLVWYEEHPLYVNAIRRETSLKRWKRAWKLELIEKTNAGWIDLLEHWNK